MEETQNEKLSDENFYKGFFHTSGKYIPIKDPYGEHHSQMIASNPELFDINPEDLVKMDYPEEIEKLKSGKSTWSTPVLYGASRKGYTRLVGEVENFDSIEPEAKIPIVVKHHTIQLHDESQSSTMQSFKKPLEKILGHLKSSLGPHDTFNVQVSGFQNHHDMRKELRDRGLSTPHTVTAEFRNMEDLHKILDLPYKRSREPSKSPSVPSSSRVLGAMGEKPEEMMQAQWNMIRRIGDSYEPTKFNTLLEKIGAAKKGIILEAGSNKNILGTNPMQLTPEGLRRHLQKFSRHISLEDGGKHIIVRDRNGNKLTTFPKGKIGPKGAIGTLTIVRDHLEKSGVYTRQGNESSGVGAQKRQNVVVDDNQISPEEKQKAEEARLSAKRDWLKTILSGRLKQKKRERLENKRQRIEKALARARKLQSTNPKPEQQELRQYK